MKKKVYLDHNIIILAESDKSIFDYLCSVKNRYTYYYSPAHIEEIYKKYKSMISKNESEKDCKFKDGDLKELLELYLLLNGLSVKVDIDYIISLMKSIELLTGKKDICPYFSSRKNINIVINESVLECFGRVSRIDTTDEINIRGKKIYDKAIEFRNERVDDKTITNIPNLNEKDIWENSYVNKAIDLFNSSEIKQYIRESNNNDEKINNSILGISNNFKLKKFLYKKEKCSRREVELTFEILFEILNANGYCREKDVRKSVSSIHDVSHAIYGLYCDIFITADKSFYKKIKAVYYYLGIEKEVYFCPQKESYTKISEILI